MCGDVGDSRSLTCGMGGMARGPFEVSGRRVGVTRRGASLRHPDFAARPRSSLVDSMARPRVVGPHRLEEMQDVLRARGRPEGKQLVVRIRKRATTANRDEARVSFFWEDQRLPPSCLHPANESTVYPCV